MITQSPEQLGAVIRARRRELKVTQKDLALTCGTGLRFIIDLEKGKPTCQIGKILQVLQALGLKFRIAGPSAHANSRLRNFPEILRDPELFDIKSRDNNP
ncbi:MAG: helix-turn-helix transcriptional regulator [Candidatus Auribacterota bacterium]|nr:helix-turn-helix transcriptional regulator [Candidatus Auribacterota bacterium]